MLKKTIKFIDYNGEERVEDFFFNISKAELIEMEVSEKGGFSKMIERLVQTKDNKTLFSIFKQMVLLAYGQKSPDGRQFIKSQELRDSFEQTEAYTNLLMEFLTGGATVVAEFFKGIVPADISKDIPNEISLDSIKNLTDNNS